LEDDPQRGNIAFTAAASTIASKIGANSCSYQSTTPAALIISA
jgi:hypothetical protein